jgi:hypothetical protein
MILLMLKILLGWMLLSVLIAYLWGRFVAAGLRVSEPTQGLIEPQESADAMEMFQHRYEVILTLE